MPKTKKVFSYPEILKTDKAYYPDSLEELIEYYEVLKKSYEIGEEVFGAQFTILHCRFMYNLADRIESSLENLNKVEQKTAELKKQAESKVKTLKSEADNKIIQMINLEGKNRIYAGLEFYWRDMRDHNISSIGYLSKIAQDFPEIFLEDLRYRIKRKDINYSVVRNLLNQLNIYLNNSTFDTSIYIDTKIYDLLNFALFLSADTQPSEILLTSEEKQPIKECEEQIKALRNNNANLKGNLDNPPHKDQFQKEIQCYTQDYIDEVNKLINANNKEIEKLQSEIQTLKKKAKDLIELKKILSKIDCLYDIQNPDHLNAQHIKEISQFYENIASKFSFVDDAEDRDENIIDQHIKKIKKEINQGERIDLNKFRIKSGAKLSGFLHNHRSSSFYLNQKESCDETNIGGQIKRAVHTALRKYQAWYKELESKQKVFCFNFSHDLAGQKRAKKLDADLKEENNLLNILRFLKKHFSGEDYKMFLFRAIGNHAHSFDTFLLNEFAAYGVLHFLLEETGDRRNNAGNVFISPASTRGALVKEILEDAKYRCQIKTSLCHQIEDQEKKNTEDLFLKSKQICNDENVVGQIKKSIHSALSNYENWYGQLESKQKVNFSHGQKGQERAKNLYNNVARENQLHSILNILKKHFSGKGYKIFLFRGTGNHDHSFDTFLLNEFARYGVLHYVLGKPKDEKKTSKNVLIPSEEPQETLANKIKVDSHYRSQIIDSWCHKIDRMKLADDKKSKSALPVLQNGST